MKKIGILGSGDVSTTLANGLLTHGYAVKRGSREPAKFDEWKRTASSNGSVGTFAEAAEFGELVILAVKGSAAEAVIEACGTALNGKAVIDTTNPIADAPPVNGVLSFFTGINDSLMERLQKRAPAAHFVKAFSCVGNAFMIGPVFEVKPTMFICGDNSGAKAEVAELLTEIGWEVSDMGKVESARAIEPLCMLWCIPGLSGGGWTHAFKLLKK